MKKMTALIPLLMTINSFAASYDTLPKNVNTLVLKQVATTKIESKYNSKNENETLMLNETFTTSNLSEISDAIKSYFDELKNISPDAYNSFSLGEFEAKASANVNAQGIGFGRGITDRLTVYASLPVYHIKTEVNFYQKNSSNLSQVKNTVLNSNPTTAIGTFVKQLTLQLPETNEELLQSVLVNYYGYKPLGTWEKDTLGDAEVGMIYRLTNRADMGMAIAFGAVLPTGSKDDPDSLQDVATGDGQMDAFIETMHGINFYHNTFALDLKTRFTYQVGANKDLRLYNDPEVPLSEKTTTVYEKLGNKLDATLSATYNHNIWLSFSSAFIYNQVGKTDYSISDAKTKNAMESGTDINSQWAKLSVGISTIDLYKAKRFEIPFEVVLSGQKLLNAKNSVDYNRFDIDFKLYF